MSTPNNHIPTILIIGAGPGGLLLYHGIQKHLNKNVKKFNVKIFERDIGPQDRWQGYNIGLYPHGIRSLISCLPESLVTRLSEVMPDPIHEKEYHGVISCDHKGTELSRSTSLYFKSLFELAMMPTYPMMSTYSVIISYRNKLRDLMLEGVDIQWGKKCIGYDECDNEVWAIFQDGTRVRGDILIGCDGINSPIRKQKLPHLQLFDYGITQFIKLLGTLTYNPLKRRPVQDINPMSVEAWESTRVTLLGDAIHAMNPFLGYGTNNALQDAESLVKCLSNYEKHGYRSCIREYENEMRVRSSKDVLESRESCLTQNLPKSEYGYLFNDIYLSGKL
ncbi:hypothetical protein GLOIN_2v1608858 [Rhizophagus clarus]|uniref:FAD-binding domain-containing protein n=1 Tax=Rhizophagus clarus TaxID=94130 RepID=A0A8H3LDH5_9GLOM|nr:hypothetical protein GLOIN_2v1608858 [Rhizophagus clarus]